MDLLKYSDDLQREAEKILTELDLLQLFAPLGEVSLGGSIVHKTMYRRDIDIYVHNTDGLDLEKVAELTAKLILSQKFKVVAHWNCVGFTDDRNLKGYYWKLVYTFGGFDWKFDVWYLADLEIYSLLFTDKIKKLLEADPEKRLEILKMKEKYFDGEKYSDGYNGHRIYCEVFGI